MDDINGVLLINLGTPDSPGVSAVRRYLREFLSDPRVLDMPAPMRWLLLNLIILPFRPKKSAAAYAKVWTEQGSPLLIHTQALTDAVALKLRDDLHVRCAMRYGNPSIRLAIEELCELGCNRLTIVPLYPQYASSSTGSVLEEVYRICATRWNVPSLRVIPPFYNHPGFRDCLEQTMRENLGDPDRFDFFLMSFHGLPERHITKSDLSQGKHCLRAESCCDRIETVNQNCYRAQSFASARDLARRLNIPEEKYSVAFQSRLGRTPWIKPYTDELLTNLPKRGVKRLAVLIPSFTADCLETLEEIQIRGRESFIEAGGEELVSIPCLNAHPAFVSFITKLVQSELE